MSKISLERLQARFPKDVLAVETLPHGDDVARVRREAIVEICHFLRDDPELDFKMLSDLTIIDSLTRRSEAFGGSSRASMEAPPHVRQQPSEAAVRFTVIYQLYSITKKHRVRLKADLDDKEPHLESVSSLWKTANWLERAAFDLFGVKFDGHPNMERIFLYPEFKGYPLRKDYPVNKRQPLVEERNFPDLVRGPGPGPGGAGVPMSQTLVGRINVNRETYD